LTEHRNESVISYKKVDTGCCNSRRVSVSPTTYAIVSNHLLSKLTPYVAESFENYEYGFRRVGSTVAQVKDKK